MHCHRRTSGGCANGTPPVSNFGWVLRLFDFRAVTEVQTAFSHLLNFSLTTDDWRVFGYLVGRGALWIAVATAFWSMFDYFRYFYYESKKRQAEIKK